MKKNGKSKIAAIAVSLILIVIDQIIKIWAYRNLRSVGSIDFISGFLRLTYVENSGAAFGLFQNSTKVLAVVCGIILIVILLAVILDKIEGRFITWTLMVIFAGGMGNVIDRFFRGFVIDYLDLQIGFLKSFPVFNFADCCVTIGAVLLAIYILKFDSKDKEEKVIDEA